MNETESAADARRECLLIDARLPAAIEDDLAAGEAALLHAHLEDCARCRAAWDTLDAARSAFRACRPATDDVEALRAALGAALDREGRAPRPPRFLTAAAGLLFAALAGLLALHPPRAIVAPPARLEKAARAGIDAIGRALDALPSPATPLLERAPVAPASTLPSSSEDQR